MTTEFEHDCKCDDPMQPGTKLLRCGSRLCEAIQHKLPLLFNGHAFILGDDEKFHRVGQNKENEDSSE